MDKNEDDEPSMAKRFNRQQSNATINNKDNLSLSPVNP